MLLAACDRISSSDPGTSLGDAAPVPAGVRHGSAPKPFDLEPLTISRREHVELKLRARQHQSLRTRALERMQWLQQRHDHELARTSEQIAQLQAELVLVRAQNRDLRQRVFGSKTEQSRSINVLPSGAVLEGQASRRPRGHQRGRRGHGRLAHPELAAVVGDVGSTITCPRCAAAATLAWGSDDAQVLEIDVRAYRRIVRRRRYRPVCRCGCLPAVVTAPAADALWPRSKLGISIGVELLLSKFL